jgi:Outer membrane protein beta-barrel domain
VKSPVRVGKVNLLIHARHVTKRVLKKLDIHFGCDMNACHQVFFSVLLPRGGKMRRPKLLIGLLLIVALPTSAQNFPKVEASAGYMYLRFNPTAGASANCNGGYGSVAVNLNTWFGVAGNVDACKTNRPAPATNGTATTFLFGPKFAYRKCCRLTPFGQLLVGGIHGTSGFPGLAAPTNAFSLAAGGGLDVKPWKRCFFAIRVAEVDYLLTRFNASNQNNFQFKAGIVFRRW